MFSIGTTRGGMGAANGFASAKAIAARGPRHSPNLVFTIEAMTSTPAGAKCQAAIEDWKKSYEHLVCIKRVDGRNSRLRKLRVKILRRAREHQQKPAGRSDSITRFVWRARRSAFADGGKV
jgi:hypothetical protein